MSKKRSLVDIVILTPPPQRSPYCVTTVSEHTQCGKTQRQLVSVSEWGDHFLTHRSEAVTMNMHSQVRQAE